MMCCIWISTRPSASRRSRCGCTGPTKGGLASAESRWPTKYIEYWPGWRCLTQPVGTSSVHTLKLVKVAGPKLLLSATSAASRPRAINTLPMRGVLWRASKVCHCPPRNTSNQAEKSIGASTGGTPGAVARRDVHAATEGHGKMREITADAGPVIKSFQRCAGHARVLVAEREMSVNVVADCLHTAPSRWRLPKKIPRRLRQPIGFAIPAPEQEDKRLLGQVRHRNLLRLGNDDVGQAGIADERIGRDTRAALGRNNASAPVAEAVSIGCHRD